MTGVTHEPEEPTSDAKGGDAANVAEGTGG